MTYEEDHFPALQKKASKWFRQIETGKIPNPKHNKRRRNGSSNRPAPGGIVTFLYAQEQFIDEMVVLDPEKRDDPDEVRRHRIRVEGYRFAFGAVMRDDDYLTNDTLGRVLSVWLADPTSKTGRPCAEATRKLVRTLFHAFVRYCIAKGWASVDPFHGQPRAKRQKKRRKEHYDLKTRKNLIRAASEQAVARRRKSYARAATTARYAQVANLLRMQGLFGMRLGETVSIMWRDMAPPGYKGNWIDDEIIWLCKTKTDDERAIPWKALPEWRRVVEHQRRYAKGNRGKLFPWSSAKTANPYIRPVFKACNARQYYNYQHVLRGIAGEFMLSRGFDLNLIARILGHDPAILESIYLNNRTPSQHATEVADQIQAALARTQSAPNDPSRRRLS